MPHCLKTFAPVTLNLTTYPLPATPTISGDDALNANAVKEYQATNTNAQRFQWSFAPGGTFLSGTQAAQKANFKAPAQTGSGTLSVAVATLECPNSTVTAQKLIQVTNTAPSTPVPAIERNHANKVTLSWPPSADNGSISAYKVYFTNDVSYLGNQQFKRNSPFTQHYTLPATQNSHSFESYEGENYAVAISAIDNEGLESPLSGEFKFMLDDNSGPIINIDSLQLQSAASGSLYSLVWQPALDFSGILRYDIYYNGIKIDSRTEPRYDIYKNTLGGNLEHAFYVVAIDNFGKSSYPTQPVSVRLDAQAPDVPEKPQAINRTATSFTLTWQKSYDNSGLPPTYVIGVWKNGQPLSPIFCADTFYTFQSLAENDHFRLKVAAKDTSGNLSANSVTLNVYIDVTAPTAPTLLTTAAGSTLRKLALKWQPSFDAHLKGYIVYKDDSPLNNEPVPNTAFTVTGVSDLYKSIYTVRAIDENGNLSPTSNTLEVTPPLFIIDPVKQAVGIGISNPQQRLEIDENLLIHDGNLLFSGHTGQRIEAQSGALHLQAHSTAGHTLLNTQSGNVGIGTAAPQAKLHVAGPVKADANVEAPKVTVNTLTAVNVQATEGRLQNLTLAGTLTANHARITGLEAYNMVAGHIEAQTFATTTLGTQQLAARHIMGDTLKAKTAIADTLQALRVRATHLNPYGYTAIGTPYKPVHTLEVGGGTLIYGNISVAGIKVGNGQLITSLKASPWEQAQQTPNAHYTLSPIGIGAHSHAPISCLKCKGIANLPVTLRPQKP